MKIPEKPNPPNASQAKKQSLFQQSSVTPPGENSSFLEILESVLPSDGESTKDLNDLWKDLPQKEKSLIEKRTNEALELYKSHIRNILKLSLEKNTKLITIEGRKRLHSLNRTVESQERYVKILDEKLHLLTQMLVSKDNSAFQILKTLEDIRGLLYDLKM